MMGLLGNVAEVQELRPQLMNQLFLSVFYELLDSSSDGIEVMWCVFVFRPAVLGATSEVVNLKLY